MRPNLSLDAGVRFYFMVPTESEGDQVAQFVPRQFIGTREARHGRPFLRRCVHLPALQQDLGAIDDPNLPRGERTFQSQFRTECVAPPDDPVRLGTALNDEYLGPGYTNWDISIFKNVPLGNARRLQFRFELSNAFNSDQRTTVNNNATFDFTTGALTNQSVFGSLTGVTLSARRIQLGARLLF